MARAIVRYSISGEKSNQTGNRIAEILAEAGFEKIGTASCEGEIDGDTTVIIGAVQKVIAVAGAPLGGGHLDHLWSYVDDPESN